MEQAVTVLGAAGALVVVLAMVAAGWVSEPARQLVPVRAVRRPRG